MQKTGAEVNDRPVFSSRLITVIAMLGVSIGLGNVWRFPYMMGQYGGSAFLLTYLAFTILIAVPAITAEWALGRETRRGPVGAFTMATGETGGRLIGYGLVAGITIATSYYLVVIANVFYTAWFALLVGFTDSSMAAFSAGLDNTVMQYVIALGLLYAGAYVIHRGLHKGIEFVSGIFVPVFLVIIAILVVGAFSLPGALPKVTAFLKPDFSAIGIEQIFAALGQACFSVGLGGTMLLTYGSYMRETERIPGAALATGLGDAGAAIFASLFIVPTILVFGLDISAGPKLIFVTFPELFRVLQYGSVIGGIFLLSLSLVGFLSAIAPLVVALETIQNNIKKPPKRGTLIILIAALQTLLILPNVLHPSLIGYLDLIFGSGMQALGAGLAVAALTWGLGRKTVARQIFGRRESLWQNFYFFWLKWIIPAAIFLILVSYVYSVI
ncbi:MAG: sodium-dependent transporter [Gammaproteobacteria bacterium]|nr:sodium-dependent transporter [Gammaproteobacteria bacterium]